MGNNLKFYNTRTLRAKLTRQQQKNIHNLYKEISKDVAKEAEKLKLFSLSTSVSANVKQEQLKELAKQIDNNLEVVSKELNYEIENNMRQVAQESIKDSASMLVKSGVYIQPNLVNVPDEIVRRIATGKIYESNWTLSKAIWGENKKVHNDIQTIIAKGTALNKSSYAIAKDLEKYVNPSAKKDYEWSKTYPGTNKKVDYNAQRLARTMVSHAYQQSLVMNAKYNPFVTGLRWLISNSGKVCDVCEELEGQIFKPEELPLDHPNGMCTFEAVIEDDEKAITDRLVDWVNGKEDKELDKFSEFLQGDVRPVVAKPKKQSDVKIKRRGHVDVGYYDERIKDIQEQLGVDEQTAIQYYESIQRFTGQAYSRVIEYQLTGKDLKYYGEDEYIKNITNSLHEFLDKAPKWDNSGPIYRGIKFDKDDEEHVKIYNTLVTGFKEGNIFTSKTFRSYTSDLSIAEDYARTDSKLFNSIIYVLDKTDAGVAVSQYSQFDTEKEILMQSNTKFKIIKVENESNGTIKVHIEEVK